MPNLPLFTKRLCIRYFRPDDNEDFFAYRSDPATCKFQGYEPYTPEKCMEFAESQSRRVFGEPGEWVQLGIELAADQKLIGDIGLKPDHDDTRIVTFGITLSPHYQRLGYAREAMTAVLSYLFNECRVNRVTGIADQENEASVRLMQALGFKKEGATRESFWNNGMWRDEYLFALLKKEWGSIGTQ